MFAKIFLVLSNVIKSSFELYIQISRMQVELEDSSNLEADCSSGEGKSEKVLKEEVK